MAKISEKMRKKMEKRQKELEASGGGKFNTFMIKEGTTRMRALNVGPDEEFAREGSYIYVNKDIGGFISPTAFGERCAWTEKYEKLKAGDDNDKKLADKMRPKLRLFSPHIRYKDEKGKEVDTEAGAKLLVMTKGLYQSLIDYYLDDDYGDMTDYLEGYDIKYKRTGKGKNDTEYSARPCPPSKLPKEFRKVYDIEAMMRALVPTYEQTKEYVKAFLKSAPDDEQEVEEPRKDKKKKKKSKSDI